MEKIIIIGAGLAGSLLALYLSKRSYKIEIYEARPDLRQLPIDYGRSINLALSKRGITSLEKIGLMNAVWPLLVPMRGRAIHTKEGDISYQAFGRNNDEFIHAVKRCELNAVLLNQIDKDPNISLNFNHRFISADFEKKQVLLINDAKKKVSYNYQRLIGADGAGSRLRDYLNKEGLIKAKRDFLPHSYKEINIAKSYAKTQVKEHLHLWARKNFMLLGNPNKDNSITATLFMANDGDISFSTINSQEKILSLFSQEFSDVSPYLPNLAKEYLSNPLGRLSTITCSKWYYQDQCLLLGDAAHGVVPFFGQGMNCAFEDCRVLDSLLDKFHDKWDEVLPEFSTQRKINTKAIANMSMDNYYEIQAAVCDNKFNLKKSLELEVMRRYPDSYISKHVLVMFSNQPYAYAKDCGRFQDDFLTKACQNISSLEQLDWSLIACQLKEYNNNISRLNQQYKI